MNNYLNFGVKNEQKPNSQLKTMWNINIFNISYFIQLFTISTIMKNCIKWILTNNLPKSVS